MKALRWSAFPMLFVFAALLAWHHVTAFRESVPYGCDAPLADQFSHPYIPLIGQFVFVDSLEVYVGGWIERGSVILGGDVISEPLSFTAGERPTMISFARMGEWYRPDFNLTFKPSTGASCRVRIVYRFRGIY